MNAAGERLGAEQHDAKAWAEAVDEAVRHAVSVLEPGEGSHWSRRAGSLTWDCRETALHLASDFVAYAGQLAAPRAAGYVPFDIAWDGDVDAAGIADGGECDGRAVGVGGQNDSSRCAELASLRDGRPERLCSGPVSLIWPHCDGLIWPHLRHAGDLS
jgi:hypothetical protein